MGKLLRTKSLTTGFEAVLLLIIVGIIGAAVYYIAPGLMVGESKALESLNVDAQDIDNVTRSEMLPLPSNSPSLSVQDKPLMTWAGYAWNGQAGVYAAAGGSRTMKGSLMEKYGVNINLVRQDWLSGISEMQMKFIEQLNSGVDQPDAERAAAAVMIMGDGAPFYISTRQKAIDEKFGEGKYHLQVIGAIGMSNGEDKLIGPPEWKTNPKSMLGALISTVPGDGDWVTTLNYCFANKLKVNPNFNTYDPDAVNFFPSADDDYINSAKELIASQTEGFAVDLKVVKDGKLTGETISKKIDGCATWTPGDKMVFDALSGFTDVASTADFKNQMATTIIIVKEWAEANSEIVSNALKAIYTATNQMKQHDQWKRLAAESVAKGFNLENADYWYNMAKGQKGTKGGVSYNMGGTRYLTYADAMQYYGITDGVNRYKSVYNQVSNYLTELNPFDFNDAVDRIIPYNEAVNLFFLKNINDIDSGQIEKIDYAETKTSTLASGEWNINFDTGSATIKPNSYSDLETVYNLLVQAEQTKVEIVGHTDNTGSSSLNMRLSGERAESVANHLLNMGLSHDRIQLVDGKGDTEPIADNNSVSGRSKNRRVQITLLQ